MTTQPDIPDLIAGALGVSRGTAYDMMREALAEQAQPVAQLMDMIVGNLVREGINKHRARELAEHFIKQSNYTNGYCTGRADLLKEQAAQKPMAWTTGFHAGHCVIRAADPAAILPIGVALYTSPPPRQPLTDEIKDAFYEGFTSVETYNDTNLVDVDDAWKKYKAAHGIKGEA
jgi:hypothetical protein